MHNVQKVRALLTELASFFDPANTLNPLRCEMQWSSVRLNLAGGEPLLYERQAFNIITQARELGFEVSMITNGSRLSRLPLDELAGNLCLLGVSVDSAERATNLAIGRKDRRGQVLEMTDLQNTLFQMKQKNPAMRLKINTVVNALNHQEDMSRLIESLNPERWKVLRMLPVITTDLSVSDEQFDGFVHRHRHLSSIMCVENSQDQTESYIMIDPQGRFFQNSRKAGLSGYQYSRPILETGAQSAFTAMKFTPTRFMARYEQAQKAAA